MADTIAREAPRMGHAIATELLACAFWPAAPDRPLAPVTPSGLAPVLVVGGTGDAATPYDDAEAVAGHLPGAVLLTADQPGHTAVLSSRCVHDEVLRYLVDLELPAPGTVCRG
jgi:pimeloyl-ACP methyl ester carboxylesterase